MVIKTDSPEATAAVAAEFAKKLSGGELVSLIGDLGAGKTTFVRGVVRALGSDVRVKSPTFTVLNEYPVHSQGIARIVHADLYRFGDPAHLEGVALDDAMQDDTVVFVEWPNIFEQAILQPDFEVRLTFVDEHTREIEIIPIQ